MVVLAASITTRGGKPVLSRQFCEMPRSRVEALLASFPKLISAGAQHTSVETDAVRYVYQPLEDLYMILITTKSSNILQDIDSLHLFARTVADICRGHDERDILRNSFELLGAFDEIVSLGYRENVSLAQIRSIMEMESHEEKIQEIIERNKEMEAKEELKRRAKQLELQRREATRRGGSGGFGGNIGGYQGVSGRFDAAPVQTAPIVRDTGATPSVPSAKPFKSKGMQLGKKKPDLLGAIGVDASEAGRDVESAQPLLPAAASAAAAPTRAVAAASDPLDLLPPVVQESVHLVVKERVSMEATRDGSLSSLELKGDLELRVTDPSLAKLRLQIAPASPSALLAEEGLSYKTHPHVDKKAWSDSRIIALRDVSKPFPVRQNLGVLRWRATTKDETAVPLSINCWPSPAGDGSGACDVTIEYELEATQLALSHVVLSVPLPDGVQPSSIEAAEGAHEVVDDGTQTVLQWRLDEVSSDVATSGQLEFSVTEGAEDVGIFFPVRVDFVSQKTMAEVQVDSIVSAESGIEVAFSSQTVLSAENYLVV
ncbi:hypothetical protein IE81DRAFT_319722 [Ceraceosorus guamensis]|uniref:Coatomer subunit delta n=1 Tax=Ceraceosorus guamensis TaxID=1522189 RepID=A0A316W7M8_9BASI|nr:hypothetical protein IE81DRAFT_319722 [Ceraceosorus guamensis]PWN45879.1 hypothetical protein IE81DRAFT_319722 [Ceraceosorus guamensis]